LPGPGPSRQQFHSTEPFPSWSPLSFFGSQANHLFHSRGLAPGDLVPGIDILPFFILFFFVAGLGQELGWTGYLLLYASLNSASLAGFPYPGWIALKGLLVTLVAMILALLLPWAILLTWVFNSTGGSLLLVAVLHASEVWLAYFLVRARLDPANLDNYWGYAAVLVLTATVVVMATGPRNRSRHGGRITHSTGQTRAP
jgi:hypothetical protein